jgi:hypothetical protein
VTEDHKPTSASEIARIFDNGGDVCPIRNETGEFIGPERVWKANCEYPGLAMSRSLGDTTAKSIGVVATPTI